MSFSLDNPSDFRRKNKLKRGKPVDQVEECLSREETTVT